jgi:hypothetical protein
MTPIPPDAHTAVPDDILQPVAGDDHRRLERTLARSMQDLLDQPGVVGREHVAQPLALAAVRPQPDEHGSEGGEQQRGGRVAVVEERARGEASWAQSVQRAKTPMPANATPSVPSRNPARQMSRARNEISSIVTSLDGRRSGMPARTVVASLARISLPTISELPDTGVWWRS